MNQPAVKKKMAKGNRGKCQRRIYMSITSCAHSVLVLHVYFSIIVSNTTALFLFCLQDPTDKGVVFSIFIQTKEL